jgi:lysophospholipase L1-like esterase
VKNLLLLSASVLVSLLLLELGLRAFTPFPVHWRSHQVPDPILRWVMDRSHAEIDADGFRNPGVPETAEIVTIGDSHTYGFNARADEAWPAQLAERSGRTVYNLGMGGYGPLQYLHLVGRALDLRPQWVIVGLYVANDLSDVCRDLLRMEYWRDWASQNGIDTTACGKPTEGPRWGERERSLGFRLQESTALGSLLSVTTRDWRMARKLERGEIRPHQALAVSEPGVKAELKLRTIRHVARDMDLDEPRHARALELLTFILAQAKARSDAAGVSLGVLFIPTKYAVFHAYLAERGYPLSDEYERLVARERRIVSRLGAQLDAIAVPWADAQPRLERALAERGSPYPIRDDSHPLAPGYRAYAEAALQLIQVARAP